MTKADKMMKDLGYEKASDVVYVKKNVGGDIEQIIFNTYYETYYKSKQVGANSGGIFPMSFEEHLAVHEKLKEWGFV